MKGFDYEKANTVDVLRLIGALEHHRFHLLSALATTDTPEEEIVPLLVLAKNCQTLRRNLMQRYFNVEERHWCLIKTSATMLQIAEEITNDNEDIIKEVKRIVDQTVELATGEDISGCSACREDKNGQDN